MGKRPKRKIVLFLVEGKSDREALRLAVSELYDHIDENIEVFFPIIREDEEEKGGDITSRIGVHPRNIEDNIYKSFLRDFFDEKKILPKDIYEIIQVVDTDGAYVPDDCVFEGDNPDGLNKPYYNNNKIICQNVDYIRRRNEHKRENLDYLSSLTKLKVKQKSPKYSIYFFSCNLDHFIHHSANLDHQQKYYMARDYALQFLGDPYAFTNAIANDPDSSKGMNYAESWNYIKEGLHSLQRKTNIDILFKRLISESVLLDEE